LKAFADDNSPHPANKYISARNLQHARYMVLFGFRHHYRTTSVTHFQLISAPSKVNKAKQGSECAQNGVDLANRFGYYDKAKA